MSEWRKACMTNGSCVEVAPLPGGGVAVRNSCYAKDGAVLHYTAAEWAAFLGGVKAGEFDDLMTVAEE